MTAVLDGVESTIVLKGRVALFRGCERAHTPTEGSPPLGPGGLFHQKVALSSVVRTGIKTVSVVRYGVCVQCPSEVRLVTEELLDHGTLQ